MQRNDSNLAVRFPALSALKEKVHVPCPPFLDEGLQLTSAGEVCRCERRIRASVRLCVPCVCYTLVSQKWVRAEIQVWTEDGTFRECRGVWQRSFKAGLEAMCKQALKRFSHVCTIPGSEAVLPRLLQRSR